MHSDVVLLGHGSGGVLGHRLLDETILPALCGILPREQDDAAVLAPPGGRLAFTSDSFVVDPLVFPGGTIGDLAVNGTVNDLAMSGARPLWLSVALILEEGLSLVELRGILESMRRAADAVEIRIVTGDTKVVPRGKGDRLFVTTSGIGVMEHPFEIRGCGARTGDVVLVNGPMGDHGMAVLTCREGLELETEIRSDSAPLHGLVADILGAGGDAVHVLRDPTRGGLATTLKEIALQSQVDLAIHEPSIPVRGSVRAACALLGLDPLFVANEGKLVAIVAAQAAETVLAAMRRHPLGRDSARIGEVAGRGRGRVVMTTAVGGRRVVEMLTGEQLPRIC